MVKQPHIIYEENPSQQDEAVLIDGISQEIPKGMTPIQPFSFFIKEKDEILAGVKGASFYGCFYIDSLWVSRAHRHKGWGSQLMQESEKLAKSRNCTFLILTTMEWEALPFYQKLGFEIEFVRSGYEKNMKMYVLRKNLKSLISMSLSKEK